MILEKIFIKLIYFFYGKILNREANFIIILIN